MADAQSSTPLLSSSSSSYSTINKSTGSSSSRDPEQPLAQDGHNDRSVEDEVLPETAVVGRNLGWSSAYILIMSRVIGSGIFATPGVIVRSVGSIGISLVLWVVGALFAWFGLAVNLEYGCMLPRSGGDKVYLEFTYRRPRYLATTLIAVHSVMLGFTASNCIVFAEYVLFARGKGSTQCEVKILAVGLLATVCIIHSCFLKTGIWIQNTIGWIKIALVVFMVFTSLFAVFLRTPEREHVAAGSPDHRIQENNIWQGSTWNCGIISTAFFKVWYSYNGLQNVNNVLNEVKNPVRTLKSAASTALLSACIMYLLVNMAYFLVVPLDEIKDSGELIAGLFFERIFGPRTGRVLLPLAVATSAAGNVMVVTFSHARMVQEIARQGILPFSNFISSTKPFNAPAGALFVHFIPSFLVLILPSGNIYSLILDIEGFPAQFFAIAISLGLVWLRFKRPDLHRPYKAMLSAVWLRIALSAALIIAPFTGDWSNWEEHLSQISYAFVGLTIMSFGVLYWFVWTVLLPRLNGYSLEEETRILDDGTAVTNLVKVPRGQAKRSTT